MRTRAPAAERPERFAIASSRRDGEIVLALRGELDLACVDELSAAAADIPVGTGLVVDLTALDFLDVSGLRALLNLDRRARAEGWNLLLTSPRPAVARLFELCGCSVGAGQNAN